MEREFQHAYWPPEEARFSGPARLTVEEVEDAGLLEIIQAPGAGLGHWRFLSDLLSKGTQFVFKEPLGQSREVKVALSGLFGRFVVRAYLTRYMKLKLFAHVEQKGVVLDQGHKLCVTKKSSGDLPDWIASPDPADPATIVVAEAKGSHDTGSPERPLWSPLARAWEQAKRIRVESDGQTLSVKRIAAVARWGVRKGVPSTPWIAVRDPIDEGVVSDPEVERAAIVGIARHHIANLIGPLGHTGLATSLRRLTLSGTARERGLLIEDALQQLDAAQRESDRIDDRGGRLVGGIVSRAGPHRIANAPDTMLEALDELDLRPAFVGVHGSAVRGAIQGDLSSTLRTAEPSSRGSSEMSDESARDVPLGAAPVGSDESGGSDLGGRVIRLTSRESD